MRSATIFLIIRQSRNCSCGSCIAYIKRKNEQSADEYRIVEFDLYNIIIDILQQKAIWKNALNLRKQDFDRITKAVGNMLRITAKDSMIVSHIEKNTPEKSIVFLTGIGKCYPILRAHTVLNNLHQVIDHVPVVLFYPGKYDGQELMLFSEIKDDNYYRAFQLVE